MKHILRNTLLLLSAAVIALAGCKKETPVEQPGDGPVPEQPGDGPVPGGGSIELNKTTLAMFSGKQYQLKATEGEESDSPAKITWSSENETVATVDETGLVTAHDRGTATIKASAVFADDTVSEVKCEVSVYEVSLSRTSAVIGVKDTLMLAPYVTSPDKISYLKLCFSVLGGKEDIVKVENVTGPGIGCQAIIGVSAGAAQIVADYGASDMDTPLELVFDVKVEDGFKAYVSNVTVISGRGTLLQATEILSGTIAQNDCIDILQPDNTHTDLSSQPVVGLAISGKSIDRLEAGDKNVAFLMRGLAQTDVAVGALMMAQGTERVEAVKKVTGLLYIPGRSEFVTKGYSPTLKFRDTLEIPVEMTDTGLPETSESQSLETWQMHLGVKMEAKDNSRIICSLGQTFDVYDNGTNVGKFVVTDYEK